MNKKRNRIVEINHGSYERIYQLNNYPILLSDTDRI
jgi:hypothetical protein